jgi:hypothetical protein
MSFATVGDKAHDEKATFRLSQVFEKASSLEEARENCLLSLAWTLQQVPY